MKNLSYWSACLIFLVVSCTEEPKTISAEFFANVSVADSIDQTGDYSGFEFLIYSRTTPSDTPDTLFLRKTDSTGFVRGTITAKEEGAYPVLINRNGRNLASLRLLVADKDTIRFSGEFPGLDETMSIDSRETRSMNVYENVERNFQRTNQLILAGQVPDSLIQPELQKWVELYWEVFEGHKGTFASKFALESAITLLEKFDRKQMFDRLNQAFDEKLAYGLAITLGKEYMADSQGFDAAIHYMDSVKSLSDEKDIERSVDQAIIKMHLDSSRVEAAKNLLKKYASRYDQDESPSFWYKNIRYELYEVAPGSPAPDFSFVTTEGDTVSNERMMGTPYVLEFTLMANQLYQQQYDEATVLYQLYSQEGLSYYTLPYDQSSATILGFFEERDRFWSLADPPTYNQTKLAETFNIKYYPTRVLIDSTGNIYRKYVGEEFEDLVSGIAEIL